MVNDPAKPPAPSTQHEQYDELTGVYGFFRRHQKKLLYTAGLFTLLTFSITGPMQSLMTGIFSPAQASASIVVNGKRVDLPPEDYSVGQQVAKNLSVNFQPAAIPRSVCPVISPGDEGRADLGAAYAILRRAAIEEGVEPSMPEVDRAIETVREQFKAESAAKLSRNLGFSSLAQYRSVMAEAMRIGLYLRLQTLVFGSTEADLLKKAMEDREKITLRVATFDEKALETQLKASTTLSDDDLKAWFDGKADREKVQLQAYDLPRTQLRFLALLTADGQFDPEQWKDEALKDFVLSDDQLKGYYEQEKENRFKVVDPQPGADLYKPFEDEAVKAELTRMAQAEQVMNHLQAQMRTRLDQVLNPLNEELKRVQTEAGTAGTEADQLQAQAGAADVELAAKKRELEAKPDDEALKTAVQTAETAAATAKAAAEAAVAQVAEKKKAVTAAQDAIAAARAGFDFSAAAVELTKDKSGFVQKAMTGLKNGEQMKDLEQDELGLGTWPLAALGARLANKGDLAQQPGRTTKAVLLYQAMEVEAKPLKPWETLKPLLEGAYFTEIAKKQGLEKKALMEAALLRLAKERMPEKVAEIEATRQTRIDERVAEWLKKTEGEIAEAEQQLAKTGIGKMTRSSWQRKLDLQKAELERKDMRKDGFVAEIGLKVDAEIAEEAKKHYSEVLDAAAAEAGFTVTDFPPVARDASQEPRFDKDNDATLVYLLKDHSEMKAGEATGVLQDFANRRWHVACCTKVEPLAPSDVTRRQFEYLRNGGGNRPFATVLTFQAYAQAFTLKALEARYQFERSRGEQRDLAVTDPK